ncbi:MAG: hypothetical protein ACKV2T_22625 [Kofleriaceae bacterium]
MGMGCPTTHVASLEPPKDAAAMTTADCKLASVRCSRCHTLDRLRMVDPQTPDVWRSYVRRMRLVPASGIAPYEEPAIVRCLVVRSFGPAGLARLSEKDR